MELAIEIIKMLIMVMGIATFVYESNKLMKEAPRILDKANAIDLRLRVMIEILETINDKRDSETLEIYKDAMDRVMSKSIGQYEAVKQQRESGEPLDFGGRSTSKAENQKKQTEKIRKLREGKED